MSRLFNGTSGRIDHGGAMTKPTAVSGLTWGAWIYPVGYGESSLGRPLCFDSTHAILLSNSSGEATLRGTVGYATTPNDRRAVSSFIALNTWQFVAMTWDGGTTASSIKLYKGLPGGLPAEPASYVDITSSSGALSAFGNLIVGNRIADDRTFDGRIAHAFYANRVMTLAELAIAMYQAAAVSGLFYAPLPGVSSTEADLSGGVHSGTITGTVTQAADPPVGRYVQKMLDQPPLVFTSNYWRRLTMPYDTTLGVDLTMPYDVKLGADLTMPYDALTGARRPLEMPFDTVVPTRAQLHMPYDTAGRLAVPLAMLYSVNVTWSWTSPLRRRSVVE